MEGGIENLKNNMKKEYVFEDSFVNELISMRNDM